MSGVRSQRKTVGIKPHCRAKQNAKGEIQKADGTKSIFIARNGRPAGCQHGHDQAAFANKRIEVCAPYSAGKSSYSGNRNRSDS